MEDDRDAIRQELLSESLNDPAITVFGRTM